MDITISTSELRTALSRMSGITVAKGSLPLLSCVLLEATTTPAGGRLNVKATDLEISSSSIHAAEVKKEGSLAVPAKSLLDIVKSLPETTCRLRAAANNRLEVSSGASTFRLAGHAPDDFPALSDQVSKEFAKVPDGFADVMEAVAYAMSTDETRYNLNGVFFDDRDEALTLVATDGHRLAMQRVVGFTAPGLAGKGVIVGGKAVQQLGKLISEGGGELAFTPNTVEYRRTGLEFSARLIDGQFPDYTQVIPATESAPMKAGKDALSAAMHRVMLILSKGESVNMDAVEGQLKLTARNPDMGDSSETLAVDFAGKVEIALNGSYLLETLASLTGDTARLFFGDEVSPVVVMGDNENAKAVLMPMRK